MTKIEDSELYQLELARLKFQGNVSSILEMHGVFSQKRDYAKSQKKEYLTMNTAEAEVVCSHQLAIATGLAGSFDIMNAFCQRLIFENRTLKNELSKQLREYLTPTHA